MQKIEHQRLMDVLAYEPSTGLFHWLVRKTRRVGPGALAGSLNARGYRYIEIDGTAYRAGRLAWFYVHGVWPADEIDHANGRKDDDRFCNLREASKSQNLANVGRHRNNKSGFKGVYARRGGFHAQIKKDGIVSHLGDFDSASEAHAAYVEAALRFHAQFARAS